MRLRTSAEDDNIPGLGGGGGGGCGGGGVEGLGGVPYLMILFESFYVLVCQRKHYSR